MYFPGAVPRFQVRGAHLKKLRRAQGGAKNLGYFVWKITILRQKILFFPILGGGEGARPPTGSAPAFYMHCIILSVRDERYSRNASCALNLISTFLFYNYVLIISSWEGRSTSSKLSFFVRRKVGFQQQCLCDFIVTPFNIVLKMFSWEKRWVYLPLKQISFLVRQWLFC